jgi:hypothetical protein
MFNHFIESLLSLCAKRVYPGEGSDDEEVDDDEEGNMEYEEEGEKRVYPGEGSDDEEVDDEEVTDDEEGNMEYEEGNMEYEEEGEMPDSEDVSVLRMLLTLIGIDFENSHLPCLTFI